MVARIQSEAKQGILAETKSWDKSKELQLLEYWGKNNSDLERFDTLSSKPIIVIDTPPPYPSGKTWHIGAAAQYSQIDMIARASRMFGKEVLFPIGIDRNGLPVEIYTEKKYNVSMRNTPREKFLELCSTALDELELEIIAIMKRMGLSGDFENKYRTDSEKYRILTQATFIEEWNRGRIYLGKRPSNYCVDCGTTIADAEIEYKEIPTELVYFKFKGKDGTDNGISVASTRPELVCTCQAVIVNPDDARYTSLIGKKVIVPLFGREVPIIAHPYATPEFGTGALMVCSYGDYEDALLFRELDLKEIIAIGLDGRMTFEAGPKLCGLKVKAARKATIDLLKEAELVEKIDQIEHRTPMCERSKTPIEIIPLEEYYLKVVEYKDTLRRAAHELRFHPDYHRQILLNWIDVALDWPITRRRFYGTEVPVWYCKSCGAPHIPRPGTYYQPWKEPPPVGTTCSKCGSTDFIGDDRTFDTWMDSSVSELFITRYLWDKSFFEKTYHNGVRPQGKDIVRTWLHYSILRCLELTGKTPWQDVWIGGMGLDEKGERMSKSRGNVVDPVPILEQYGADNFRLWAASEVSVGSDFNVSVQKIAGTGKFLTKLWNIARYISALPPPVTEPSEGELQPSDKWMLAELSRLTEECLEGYLDFNFFIPANRIRDFTWNVFAPHYIELAKGRAYGQGFTEAERASAIYTLHKSLRTIILLLAPICPFITEEIWLAIYSQSTVHREHFPEPVPYQKEYLDFGKNLMEFDSMVWNEKKRKGISLKDPIAVSIPPELNQFATDLKAMHNLQS